MSKVNEVMGKLVVVTWLDSYTGDDPAGFMLEDLPTVKKLKTVGWVVRDDEYLGVCQEMQDGGKYTRTVFILAGNIVDIEVQ